MKTNSLSRMAVLIYGGVWTVYFTTSIVGILVEDPGVIALAVVSIFLPMPVALWGFLLRKPLWQPTFWRGIAVLASFAVIAWFVDLGRIFLSEPAFLLSPPQLPFLAPWLTFGSPLLDLLVFLPGFVLVYRYPYTCFAPEHPSNALPVGRDAP